MRTLDRPGNIDGSKDAQDASSPAEMKRRGRQLLEHERPAEAQEILEQAAREQPQDAATLGLLLKAARARGREEDELAICRLFREHFPDRPGPQLRLLRLLEARQAPEVEQLALDLQQRFRDQLEPLEILAKRAEQAGDHQRAMRLWSEILVRLQNHPPGAQTLKRIGRELLKHERPEEAQEILERAALEEPNDAATLGLLLEAARAQGREEDELAVCRLFRKHFPSRPTPQVRLLRLLEARQAHEAEELARVLQQQFPDLPDPFATPARLAEQAGDYQRAARLWTEMLAHFRGSPAAGQALTALKRLGRELLECDRPEAAQEVLEQAARAEPNDAAILGLLLEATHVQGREEDELAVCRLFRDNFPDRPKPQLRLLKLLEARQAPDAEALARDLDQRFPERPEPLGTLARLTAEAGDYAAAVSIWSDMFVRFAGSSRAEEARKALRQVDAPDAMLQALRSAHAANEDNHWLIGEIAFLEQRRNRFASAATAWKEWMSFEASGSSMYLDASQAFLEAGEPALALRALRIARKQGAHQDAVVRARAALAERLHHWPVAFRAWRTAMALSPGDRAPLRRLIRCLVEAGEFDEAKKRLREALTEDPGDVELLLLEIRLMQRLLRMEDALETWKHITSSFPGDPRGWAGLARAYSSRLETETAEWICRDALERLGHPRIRLALIEALAQRRSFDDAENLLTALESEGLEPLQAAQTRARVYVQQDRFAEASEALVAALPERPGAVTALVDLANIHIRAGQNDDAEQVVSSIAPGFGKRRDVAELRAWVEARNGSTDAARKIWKRHVESHLPAARPLATPLVATEPYEGGDRDLQLFAFLRNERTRLPFFLDYYRKLGAKRFLLVDNGSDDGSAEFLDAQDDVFRFGTKESYREAASGMRWINHLIERFGGTGWSLHVDIDEFLVLPGSEGSTLDDYIRYLEDNNYEVLRSFLIDMFPETLEEAEAYREGDNPLCICRLFDNDYRFYGGVRSPYIMVEGGFRERHFGQFGLHLCKTPLVRCGRGIKFLASSHVTSPARVADLTAASLHFKFLGQFKERLAEEAQRRQYSNSAKNITQLHKTLSLGLSTKEPIGPNTLEYGGSRQLLELGLIAAGGFASRERVSRDAS